MEKKYWKKVSTKYFEDIDLNLDNDSSFINGWASFNTIFRDQNVFVGMSEYNLLKNKPHYCWEVIDKYIEINEIAKEAIIKKYNEKHNVIIKYFKKIFRDNKFKENIVKIFSTNDLKKLDIRAVIEKIDFPDLSLNIEDGIMIISAKYTFYEITQGKLLYLCVLMNKELEIIDYEMDFE